MKSIHRVKGSACSGGRRIVVRVSRENERVKNERYAVREAVYTVMKGKCWGGGQAGKNERYGLREAIVLVMEREPVSPFHATSLFTHRQFRVFV